MLKVSLGKTGFTVNKNGFGALPIQRIAKDEAVIILRKALEKGITYFDTARAYTDSEEKIGLAFEGMRDKVIIATKTGATTVSDFKNDLATSLRLLKTDHIDLYQFHNLPFCPKPSDGTGLYEAMLEAKEEGKIRHIGITNHRLSVASEAIDSGLYETLQFPFSYLASDKEMELVSRCKAKGMGFVCMKALAGGLITDSASAYAFLAQFDNVLPIWGIQRERELDEFISYQDNPPVLDAEKKARIEADREMLSGNFCRGCGYCKPCPAGIEIENCNRMYLFLRRAPYETYLTEKFAEKMKQTEQCRQCGQCRAKCPYGLDIPNLLKQNHDDFFAHWKEKDKYLNKH